jgi:CheY-like chemotaxis protein/anti-sigma regulatory factor (Ser/Thr protein kinase)
MSMATILVVDDSAIDRKLAASLLEKVAGTTVSHAEDGKAALAQLEQSAPDLVLTDMSMPEMDGLELVKHIRKHHPLIPVILMTAYGSEEVAIEALRIGAASYVPKKNLAQDLTETVRDILNAAQASRSQQRLIECLAQTEAHFLLDNDPSLIPPLLGFLQESLSRMRLCDEIGKIRVSVALQEALYNAIYHGNLEVSSALREQDNRLYLGTIEQRRKEKPYRNRRVEVIARESPAEVMYTIRDEGPGFDPSTLPDPTDPANLERVTGRGLLLIRTFMDKVYHNEKGNQIVMVKRRDK